MRPVRSYGAALTFVFVFVSCRGEFDIGALPSEATTERGIDDAGAGDSAERDSSDAALAQVTVCTIAPTCDDPHVGPHFPTTSADGFAVTEGRWIFCPGEDAPKMFGAPSDAIGIEFGIPDDPSGLKCGEVAPGCGTGDVYFLVQGAAGPERGAGFAYQAWYGFGMYGQVTIALEPNADRNGTLTYSSCPRQLEFEFDVPTPYLTLVPL